MVMTLSYIGLPLTNGFVGEFLIMLGGFKYRPFVAVFAVTGVIFGALYMLSLYRRVVFGPLDEARNGDLVDLTWREKIVLTPLLILVFAIGLYPQPIFERMEASSRFALMMLDRQNGRDVVRTVSEAAAPSAGVNFREIQLQVSEVR